MHVYIHVRRQLLKCVFYQPLPILRVVSVEKDCLRGTVAILPFPTCDGFSLVLEDLAPMRLLQEAGPNTRWDILSFHG